MRVSNASRTELSELNKKGINVSHLSGDAVKEKDIQSNNSIVGDVR
jgi:hypothetical protein